MLLKLDVLTSTTIKRKKSWPKLAWLGKVSIKHTVPLRVVFFPVFYWLFDFSLMLSSVYDVMLLKTYANFVCFYVC